MTHLYVKEMRIPEVLDETYEADHNNAECLECGETFPMKRALLGYNVCLACGDIVAASQRASWCIVPTPKGHYTRVTNKADLLHLNQKTR